MTSGASSTLDPPPMTARDACGASGYRADLDGLRAIAVLAVVLYHLEWAGFSGGYVGVDVFFVLSGYLISRLIARDLVGGRFRFSTFYGRRIRRLFPALLATVIVSFIVAVAIDPAPQLEAFAREGASALFSVSNFLFWQQSGYFAADAYSKPLLHTWSLGIEEQFYLLWPALWVGLLRFRSGRWALPGAALLGVGSWAIAEMWLGSDPAAAFFLLPARVFEFMLGTMLVGLDRVPAVRGSVRDGSTLAGLALIAYSVTSFDEWTRFPGSGALIPCLGAALVIGLGSGPWLAPILNHPAAVALGRISYSLYLVHWPVVVFYRAWTLEPFSDLERLLLLGVSLLFAVALHAGVEARWRLGGRVEATERSRRIAWGMVATTMCLAIAFLHVQQTRGWTWRYPASALEMGDLSVPESERMTWPLLREVEGRPFRSADDRPRVLVVGDSQAGDFINLLAASGAYAKEDLSSIVVMAECGSVFVPLSRRDAYFRANRRVQQVRNTDEQIESCVAQWERLFSDPRLAEATHIYVANLWYDYHLPHLEATVRKLRSESGAEIRFVGNKALSKEPTDYLANCFRPAWLNASHCVSRADLNRRAAELLAPEQVALASAMTAQLEAAGVEMIDLFELVCPETIGCRLLSESGRPIYFDRFHTTRSGVQELASGLSRWGLSKPTGEARLGAALGGMR